MATHADGSWSLILLRRDAQHHVVMRYFLSNCAATYLGKAS